MLIKLTKMRLKFHVLLIKALIGGEFASVSNSEELCCWIKIHPGSMFSMYYNGKTNLVNCMKKEKARKWTFQTQFWRDCSVSESSGTITPGHILHYRLGPQKHVALLYSLWLYCDSVISVTDEAWVWLLSV